MGWIYCPNCKHKTSSKAIRCPYCGYQIKEDPNQARRTYYNRYFYLNFLAAIIALIALIPILLQSHDIDDILLAFVVISVLLILIGGYKLNNRKQKPPWARFAKKPSKDKKRPPLEETYYYKGKTNQQLPQYNEALQCYSKALELNPDFEPAKVAKKEVEKSLNK